MGGGQKIDEEKHTLSNVSLRWMIREIVRADCAVLFDPTAFKRWHIPISVLKPSPPTQRRPKHHPSANGSLIEGAKGNEYEDRAVASKYDPHDLKDVGGVVEKMTAQASSWNVFKNVLGKSGYVNLEGGWVSVLW